jgi:CubicO group peptidase (beta-lactamase class C family)
MTMNAARRILVSVAAAAVLGPPAGRASDTPPNPARELAGLWEAKRRFGPDVRGPLVIERAADGWRAEIAGRSARVRVDGDAVAFELSDGKSAFKGKFAERRARIVGHWVQPPRVENGTAYALPVTLSACGRDSWRGDVVPLDDEMTVYLMARVREDGAVGAFVRNPERNAGRFFDDVRVEREGDAVRLVGRRPGGGKAGTLAEGAYRDGTLALYFPWFGGTFDFQRVKADGASDFHPRGRPGASYAYAPPRPGDDGWPTASLEDVGISREGMCKFIRMVIDTPIDSVHSQEVHGVLIARHGKLVLEEYFHGEHRDKPHDTRSAAKSLTATLVGAAIRAGVPLEASTPVYRVMNGGTFPTGLEPRKRALTVEHLLTMSPGLDCDDCDESSRGNEDVMQEQTAQPDWYRYTLDLRAVRDPGAKAVYGSANPNLLGGVLARAAGRPLTELFHELLAEPLGIRRYHMNLTPTRDAYMGGGVRFLPRDFMKLGQLHLNGGTWNGKQVLTPEWCRRATSPLYDLRGLHYGYLWWVADYPHKGRTVRAFFAGGNGGQVVIGIPELDLLVAFYGGNYSDPATYVPQREYVPKYILPAVDAGT